MIERLELLKKRYEELNEELLNPEVLSDFSKQLKLSKEKSSIEPSVMKYDELKKVTAEIEDLKSLVNDPEMHEIASMELDEKHALLEKIKSELEILLLPKDENDGKDIIMEINRIIIIRLQSGSRAFRIIRKMECLRICMIQRRGNIPRQVCW